MAVRCPHCRTGITGAGVPDGIEPGMICPLCGKDMTALPPPRGEGWLCLLLLADAFLATMLLGSFVELGLLAGIAIAIGLYAGLLLPMGRLLDRNRRLVPLAWVFVVGLLAGLVAALETFAR